MSAEKAAIELGQMFGPAMAALTDFLRHATSTTLVFILVFPRRNRDGGLLNKGSNTRTFCFCIPRYTAFRAFDKCSLVATDMIG